MIDQTEPHRGHQRAGLLAARLSTRPEELRRPATRARSDQPSSACSPSPAGGVAKLREIAEAGETVRFVHFECADGRRVSFDHVPLGEDGAAGRLWTFRDITQFKLAERGAAAVPGDDEPRDQDAAVRDRRRGRAAVQRRPAGAERELAEVIADAAQALGGLVRDTLDVIRAEAGRGEQEAEDYDPRRLLTSIAGVLRPSLRGRPLELLVEVDADVPDALRGDAARVRQIVLNLASPTRSSTPSPGTRGSAPASRASGC